MLWKITDFLMIMFYACIQFPFNSSYPTGVLMLTSEILTAFITHVVFLTCLIQPNNFRDRLVVPCVALHSYWYSIGNSLHYTRWTINVQHVITGVTFLAMQDSDSSRLTDWLPPGSRVRNYEANSSSTSQEMLHILWDLKVHYRVYRRSPLFRVLSQINPGTAPVNFLKIHFNTNSRLRLGVPNGLFP